MVREERLELSHLTAPEPKSGVSTNSTTPASNFIASCLASSLIPKGKYLICYQDKVENQPFKLAGIPGFEPGNAEIKTRCLTAWRYPNLTFKQLT
jgi:hypothetical protein